MRLLTLCIPNAHRLDGLQLVISIVKEIISSRIEVIQKKDEFFRVCLRSRTSEVN